jgi:hypothetical protein
VASNAVDWKSMGHTVGDQSSNEADSLCIVLCVFAVFSVAVMKSVVTVSVMRNTI